MARLTRKNIKVFAENAANNGVFGSLQAGNPVTTTNVEQVQSLPAWSTGWNSATMTSEKLPPLEEFQGIQYVTTYQQAYIMQEGIPEWASTVTYYKGSLTKEVTANGFRIYNSLTDNNENNLLSDTSNWKKVMDSDDTYAFDNEVVHLTGIETIIGDKTFSGNLIKQSNSLEYKGIHIQNTQLTKGTTPSSTAGGQFVFQDKDGLGLVDRIGGVEVTYDSSGSVISRLLGCQPVANSTTYASISVTYPASGSPYTSAPTPTDTTTTSGTQIATTGWVNSTNNNAVHKTGNETIAGIKTFTSNVVINKSLAALDLKHTDLTKGTTPTTANPFCTVSFKDKDGKILGDLLYFYNNTSSSAKETGVALRAYKANAASDNNIAELSILYPASGNPYTFCPASDRNGSIVTTVNKSKGANGYFQLGNGLIIQWGKSTTTSSSGNVTLPKAFSSTNYAVVINDVMANVPGSQGSHANVVGWGVIQSRSTTSFTAFLCNYENSYWWRSGDEGRTFTWIAIGY